MDNNKHDNFFEVDFGAFLSFEESQTGRKILPTHQNWFWKTWDMYWWDTKKFFYVHTCGTFFCPQREIVRFWANFEFLGKSHVCLLCASQGIHIWDTYSPGTAEHSIIMVYDQNWWARIFTPSFLGSGNFGGSDQILCKTQL